MPHRRARYIYPILLDKLRFSPVVSIQGARQTGKTFLAREFITRTQTEASYVTFDRQSDRELADSASEAFLEKYANQSPLIIDEAQKVPKIFDAIKYMVDRQRRPGKYLLLGSTEFSKKTLIREALTGRISSARMYPLTCAEALELPWTNNTSCLHLNSKPRCNRSELMRHLTQGGMPGLFSIHSNRERDLKCKEWLALTVHRDLSLIPKIKVDTELAMAILKEIATQDEPTAGNIAKKLKRDLRRIKTHLDALELLFTIHKLQPAAGSTGKPLYFLCDVAFAHYLEADFARCLHTWLVQETLANHEWAGNIKETTGYFRSSKGALTHLVVQHSRNEWTAVKIIASEKFSEKDLWSLTRLNERLPHTLKLNLVALTSTRVKMAGVECYPWESIV
jgi:predicted AAA+ superfamily ATPase